MGPELKERVSGSWRVKVGVTGRCSRRLPRRRVVDRLPVSARAVCDDWLLQRAISPGDDRAYGLSAIGGPSDRWARPPVRGVCPPSAKLVGLQVFGGVDTISIQTVPRIRSHVSRGEGRNRKHQRKMDPTHGAEPTSTLEDSLSPRTNPLITGRAGRKNNPSKSSEPGDKRTIAAGETRPAAPFRVVVVSCDLPVGFRFRVADRGTADPVRR